MYTLLSALFSGGRVVGELIIVLISNCWLNLLDVGDPLRELFVSQLQSELVDGCSRHLHIPRRLHSFSQARGSIYDLFACSSGS